MGERWCNEAPRVSRQGLGQEMRGAECAGAHGLHGARRKWGRLGVRNRPAALAMARWRTLAAAAKCAPHTTVMPWCRIPGAAFQLNSSAQPLTNRPPCCSALALAPVLPALLFPPPSPQLVDRKKMYPDIVNKKLRLPAKAFQFYDETLAQRLFCPAPLFALVLHAVSWLTACGVLPYSLSLSIERERTA